MSRTKGATNVKPSDRPEFLDMPAEERILFVANLIVDQILERAGEHIGIARDIGYWKRR